MEPNQDPNVNLEAEPESDRLTLKQIKADERVIKLIDGANDVLRAMGYTEHGHRHVGIVSSISRYLLTEMGFPERQVELGQIAGYLHDIGNSVNRINHPQIGGAMAFKILDDLGMDPAEIAIVIAAIGNHEELAGVPVSPQSAAVIIADKSDVHKSRVQNPIHEMFDIHDRVNYAVQKSRVNCHRETKHIELVLEIDTSFASVMEYFEIFLSRMVMCRKAADTLGYRFALNVNGTALE